MKAQSISQKKILLGISGSIAAYKAAILCRLLVKEGAEVRIVMSNNAKKFITPLTLSTLSKSPVYDEVTDGVSWNNHVELGIWADIMVIAPATATTLSKLVSGCADNMLIATYLSAKCPVLIAPAMDLDMWKHPSTLRNIAALKEFGNTIIPVGHGELASGLYGDGRMAEPEEILSYITNSLHKSQRLLNKTVLITAGPTYENLDPVRFIGNSSSGKMGLAIANAFANEGAQVKLVLGPVKLDIQNKNIELFHVRSANQMFEATEKWFDKSDFVIFAAAVADYRPEEMALNKIKKSDNEFTIKLVKNIDIAGTLGVRKRENQILVGFALETNNEFENAAKKLEKKNLDFIVLNSLKDEGAGFQHDTNKIAIISKSGLVKHFDLKPKSEVAQDLLETVLSPKD